MIIFLFYQNFIKQEKDTNGRGDKSMPDMALG